MQICNQCAKKEFLMLCKINNYTGFIVNLFIKNLKKIRKTEHITLSKHLFAHHYIHAPFIYCHTIGGCIFKLCKKKCLTMHGNCHKNQVL